MTQIISGVFSFIGGLLGKSTEDGKLFDFDVNVAVLLSQLIAVAKQISITHFRHIY